MRAIAQSISALVLGCSSFAFGNAAQADSGITLVYSTGSHAAYPYAVSHRYYAPRGLYRKPACALPYRGHSYNHRQDYRKHGHSHHEQVRWIDRDGYHHRDGHGDQDKHRNGYRNGDKQGQHRQSQRGEDRAHPRMSYVSQGNRQ